MMEAGPTFILTRADIRRLATVDDYFQAAVESFRAHGAGGVHSPSPMEIDGRSGAFHAKGASMTLGGKSLASLKLNGNFPFNPARFGLPTIQGAILLCDAENGALLAILDSAEITLRRTAAASAVAIDALAAHAAATLLICGCGVQGRAHIEALAPLRLFQRIFVFDTDQEKARQFEAEMAKKVNCRIEIADTLAEAARQSDIIVTTTPSRSPVLDVTHVRPGAFIAAVGADNSHKNEIAPELMQRAAIIADVADQCVVMGDTSAAIAAGVITRDNIRAELGEVLCGGKPGRQSEEEIVIFDSTGAAFQDLTAAAVIFERARSAGIGACIARGA